MARFPPDGSGGLTALESSLIPYQTSVLPVRDHWQNDYDFASTPAAGDYTIESYGKDGVDGVDITVSSRIDFTLDIVLANGQFSASPE